MKNKRLFTFRLLSFQFLLLSVIFLLNACREDEQHADKADPNQIQFSSFLFNGQKIQVTNYNELNSHVQQILNDGTQISSTELRKSEDGSFYYLYSKGKKGALWSTVGIPLDTDPAGSTLSYDPLDSGSCIHRSDQAAQNACTTCELVIYEKCKRQSCTCETEDGGCVGSIAF
ncbi:MAG: hypothetical protein IT262_11320 [Saprospiraceae bacterium]|nr:hypothetical protein [Saprospiraceae bacterium]